MDLSPVKIFALMYLMATVTLSTAYGTDEQTFTVDGIEIKLMTDLVIPGRDTPLRIIRKTLYSIPSSTIDTGLPEGLETTATRTFLLENAPSGEYTIEAINRLQGQMTQALNDEGYYGVAVIPDPDYIDMQTGEDLREPGDNSLKLQLWIGVVVEQRTIAKGKRIRKENPLNHPSHYNILDDAPFKFTVNYLIREAKGFLIDKPALDDYVKRLNRSLNRRVDVAISSSGESGKLILDYIVNEPKSWLGYIQVSNTGTEATGEWRERIGGIHYQLTGNDDILRLDYLTAEFDSANAFVGSYEFPLVRPDYWKVKGYTIYSDFAAENLQVPSSPDALGEITTYGLELAYTPFYYLDHSFSVVFGLMYEDVRVENISGNNEGVAEFLSPYLRFETFKREQIHRSFASLSFETNLKNNDVNNDFFGFGPTGTTDDYQLIKFRLNESFFLEPLLPGYRQIQPGKWLANSLIHEFAFSLRGQYTLDNDDRLIPQKQLPAGGFFSVRGYNETVTRGDSGYTASAEYRMHIARFLKPYSLLEEKTEHNAKNDFNYRAPTLYGLPDWNFLARVFVDWGSLQINNTNQFTEVEQDLSSVGFGVEFKYRSRLNIRLDYGIILNELESTVDNVALADSEKGDSRFHFLATYSF